MSLAEGEWNLSYGPNGVHPGCNFTFGTFRTGYYLLDPYEITYSDGDPGDVPLPREDGIRFGQDTRGHATITFEIGVDTVDKAPNQLGRHGANLDAVSAMLQAWDAEAVRQRFATPAVLRTVQGGRARLFYGRPRKPAPAGSRLTRQGYTPVVATFVCQDNIAYDDVEQRVRVDLVPPPHRGLVGPLTTPLTMTGQSSARPISDVDVGGTKPTWPVITIYGPISQPVCEVVGRWKASLNLTLAAGERVVIDPRPWARTVLRNGNANAAGWLYRGSPRLADMRLPVGRQDLVLRGIDATGSAYMTVAWRNAYAYL
ncbi:hypothetical protein [Streptomyces rimosus]|uniref:hypothetical protein n=1 Tax=Streptomyces rimosus TaxID=1927 RepID=UPI0004C2443C|nr:hypothetical protein [Streptomyces rimosus]